MFLKLLSGITLHDLVVQSMLFGVGRFTYMHTMCHAYSGTKHDVWHNVSYGRISNTLTVI